MVLRNVTRRTRPWSPVFTTSIEELHLVGWVPDVMLDGLAERPALPCLRKVTLNGAEVVIR